MTAINFTLEGSPQMIMSGRKGTTIRIHKPAVKARLDRDPRLQLYWKQRTRECRKIVDAECVKYAVIGGAERGGMRHWICEVATDADVYADGFDTREDMWRFFSRQYSEEQLGMMEFAVIGFALGGGR